MRRDIRINVVFIIIARETGGSHRSLARYGCLGRSIGGKSHKSRHRGQELTLKTRAVSVRLIVSSVTSVQISYERKGQAMQESGEK